MSRRESLPPFEPNPRLYVIDLTGDGPAPSRFVRGNANGDDAVDISDPIYLLNGLFAGGPQPGCSAAADVNGDDTTDISDPIYLLNHLFSGGPPPEAPYPECGSSDLPSDEALRCEAPPADCQ